MIDTCQFLVLIRQQDRAVGIRKLERELGSTFSLNPNQSAEAQVLSASVSRQIYEQTFATTLKHTRGRPTVNNWIATNDETIPASLDPYVMAVTLPSQYQLAFTSSRATSRISTGYRS